MPLSKNSLTEAPIFPLEDAFLARPCTILDLSEQNERLCRVKLKDTDALQNFVDGEIQREGAAWAAGGYGEDRLIYRRSTHFTPESHEEARSLHLGVDLWAPAFTAVRAPISGHIHSFAFNDNFGDYGATLILAHETQSGQPFFTLYGHLSLKSLQDKEVGQAVARGEFFCEFGPEAENGHWPPHLHFQVITDMLGHKGDFPGVCKPSEKEQYLDKLCVNPNFLLPGLRLLEEKKN